MTNIKNLKNNYITKYINNEFLPEENKKQYTKKQTIFKLIWTKELKQSNISIHYNRMYNKYWKITQHQGNKWEHNQLVYLKYKQWQTECKFNRIINTPLCVLILIQYLPQQF